VRNKFSGILVLNKPTGMTSHDVVDEVRAKLKMRKVGHAGTLDPIATGVLIILVGVATKLFHRLVNLDKRYRATLLLGEKTTTGDKEGLTIEAKDASCITEDNIREVFQSFKGSSLQVPPMVSAKHYKGKRLYKWAHKGIEVKREPKSISIYELNIEKLYLPRVDFSVHCSKGTYIRKLVEDIGDSLGCGAHILNICRTSVGPWNLKEAIELKDVNESYLRDIPMEV